MAAPGRPAAPLPADIEPAELPADAIEVGRILDAWGVKGWFKVLPHSADPQALFSSKRWYLQPSERGAKTFSGTVLLRVHVSAEGLPVAIDLVRSSRSRSLDRAATEAVKRWRFRPAQRNGEPVSGVVQVPISFAVDR